jgi:hypothetical protein
MRGGDVHTLVDAVPQPVRVKIGTEQVASPVFNSYNQCATARSVREAGRLIGELRRCSQVLGLAGQQYPSGAAAPGLLLDIHLLTLQGHVMIAVCVRL